MDKGDVDPKQYVSVNGGLLVQDLDVATKAVDGRYVRHEGEARCGADGAT